MDIARLLNADTSPLSPEPTPTPNARGDPKDTSSIEAPTLAVSIRPTRKRPAPVEDTNESATEDSKRAKLNPIPKEVVSVTKKSETKAAKSTQITTNKTPRPVTSRNVVKRSLTIHLKPSKYANKESEWTEEERYWIELYHDLLLYAVTNYAVTAPKPTLICAYFNAYFQGYLEEQYPKRAFRDFQQKSQELKGKTLKQIEESSSLKPREATVFQPVISPSKLEAYRTLYQEYGVDGHFNLLNQRGIPVLHKFLDNIIAQQLESRKPTWLEGAQANIRNRIPISLAKYTAKHVNEHEEEERSSAMRTEWYKDLSKRKDPRDSIDVSHGATGTREQFRMNRRKMHADTGNALLNIAIIRPAGYDGDLNGLVSDQGDVALPDLTAQQREAFEANVEAVKVGDALRALVFEKAEWPPASADTDEAAAVYAVRMRKAG
jgi:hypothetical protein